MAGNYRSFRADTFREAIRFVYDMAAPPDPDRQIVFHFGTSTAWSSNVDSDNVPFDPTAQRTTESTRPPVKVPCQIETNEDRGTETPFGTVIPTRLTVTLLDEEYAKVSDATFVTFDGDKYTREQITAPYGLFDVGLHSMVFVAVDDL